MRPGIVTAAVLLGGLVLLCLVPVILPDYYISLMLQFLAYITMATAWSVFSGATRYISLASAAFFGVGAYVFAFYGEALPLYLIVLIAAGVGFAIALIIGLSTLRLAGVFFVVFTFGLTELIRQIMIWWEINQSKTLVRHVFTDLWSEDLYYYLLAIMVVTFAGGYLIQRSRLGLALRAIGEDETVANHSGINTTIVKVTVFALSAAVLSAVGAAMTPRWTYVDPNIAFNPLISFLVLIMALLGGGGRLYGPALGAIVIVLLFEVLSANFPQQFNIVLGVCFITIVYFLPGGMVGLFATWRSRLGRIRGTAGRAP